MPEWSGNRNGKSDCMATPYSEAAADVFDFLTDWEEVANPESASHMDWSASEQVATMVGYVPYNKIRSAASFFLGFSYTSTSVFGGYKLFRKPPLMHPILGPGVRASAVSCSGVGLLPNSGLANKVQNSSVFDSALKYTNYEKALLTVSFRSTGRMQFLPDDQITDYNDEWKRWTKISVHPAIETVTVDGGSYLKFAEGTTNDPNTVAFPAPLPQLVSKSTIKVTTYGLPHDYVSRDDLFLYPTHIVSLLGCYNTSTMFDAYEPGELLFLSVEFEEMTFPMPSRDLTKALTGWNMTCTFQHSNPPKGNLVSTYYGHRLFPWRKDGKWYWATRENGNDYLAGADLRKIWKHAYQT